MKLFNVIMFGLLVTFVMSCHNEIENRDDIDYGLDYYPIDQGAEWIYASDSIIVRLGGPRRDTLHSYIREVISGEYIDEEGDKVQKVVRFWKRSLNDEWSSINTWAIKKDSSSLVKNEENIRLVRLAFPIYLHKKWDPTIYFDNSIKVDTGGDILKVYEGWDAEVMSVEAPYEFEGQSYKAMEIVMADEETVIDKRYEIDTYVKGIGMVKKSMIIYDSNGTKPTSSWEVKANSGFEHTLTLISYTK
ncbi:MAG: hypothetical protein KDC04_00975 [Saprospiraceae bacterium]|nr:hypothetical protein [Saprospiraceae bacterium]MCB9309809.1 hypothetical protein [Lewinellaceae bacterium]